MFSDFFLYLLMLLEYQIITYSRQFGEGRKALMLYSLFQFCQDHHPSQDRYKFSHSDPRPLLCIYHYNP